jgi:HD-GYP domain-containing protein (c-di-GMP phosphodiesterase class II)
LIACLDIYQAVSEERPYHPGRNHADTMKILYNMAERNLVDSVIVQDIDKILADYSGRDIPPPPGVILSPP